MKLLGAQRFLIHHCISVLAQGWVLCFRPLWSLRKSKLRFPECQSTGSIWPLQPHLCRHGLFIDLIPGVRPPRSVRCFDENRQRGPFLSADAAPGQSPLLHRQSSGWITAPTASLPGVLVQGTAHTTVHGGHARSFSNYPPVFLT